MIPLARLLAAASALAIEDLNAALAERGHPGLRPAFGYALNAVAAGTDTTSALAGALGMTKQGAAKLVTALTARGYLELRPHRRDGRAQALVLTARGSDLLAQAEQVQAELEAAAPPGLRSALEALVAGRAAPLRPAW